MRFTIDYCIHLKLPVVIGIWYRLSSTNCLLIIKDIWAVLAFWQKLPSVERTKIFVWNTGKIFPQIKKLQNSFFSYVFLKFFAIPWHPNFVYREWLVQILFQTAQTWLSYWEKIVKYKKKIIPRSHQCGEPNEY